MSTTIDSPTGSNCPVLCRSYWAKFRIVDFFSQVLRDAAERTVRLRGPGGARPILMGLILVCGATVVTSGSSASTSTERQITPESVGLTVETFYRAFSSPDDVTREKAYLYLLGVQDTTEGRSWCEYRRFKSVTLREVVGEYIQALPSRRLGERAAVVIEEALRTKLPCGTKAR